MDTSMDEPLLYLWLANIDGIGSRTAYLLLDRFESPSVLWQMSFDQMRAQGISREIAAMLEGAKDESKIATLAERLRAKKIDWVCLADKRYPSGLRYIYDSPIGLYVRGTLPVCPAVCPGVSMAESPQRYVGVVGTRKCTEYGANTAFAMSKEMAQRGVVIVSGMAAGIDSIAHKGAIAGGGKTIAVLGSGVDICYPASNRALMEDIIANGCVVSEYAPGTPPLRGHFPARNRIISGISDGLLVVEAGEKSGTLITADQALDQGKDVFAVPGNVSSTTSKGTNELIRQGAILATSVDVIFEELDIRPRKEPETDDKLLYPEGKIAALDDEELLVYDLIGKEPVSIERLSEKSGLSPQTVLYVLTCLEMEGMVQQLPGNRYIRQL